MLVRFEGKFAEISEKREKYFSEIWEVYELYWGMLTIRKMSRKLMRSMWILWKVWKKIKRTVKILWKLKINLRESVMEI